MTNTSPIQFIPREEWPVVACQFLDHTFRQSSAYADRFADRQSAESEFVALKNDSGYVGAANVRIKKVPMLEAGIAYIGRGPLSRLDSDADRRHLGEFLEALRAEYVDKRGLVLRIQPGLNTAEWNRMAEEVFLENGFSTTDRGNSYRTFLLDIDRPLEDIRNTLAKKWRYELTQSQKVEMTTRFVTDEESFNRFQSIFNEFVKAKGFEADPDADFLAPVQAALGDGEKMKIGLAEQDGRIVSGGLWGFLGDTAVWILGASTPEGLESRAAYRLQWETIALAKEAGMKWYDLGGINPETNPGVHHFKKGLGGIDVTAPGPFEAVPKSLRGKLTLLSEDVYKKLWKAS